MSRARWILFLLLSVLILAVGLLGFQQQAKVSQLPDTFALSATFLPGHLAGLPVTDYENLQFIVEGFPAGETVLLTSDSGVPAITVTPVRIYDSQYLIVTLISGLFFWAMGTFAFLPRFHIRAVAQFFWITMLYGLGILIGGVFFQREMAPIGLTLSLFQITALALLPVIFVHLSLVFPERRRIFGWRPGTPWLLYAVAAMLIAWQTKTFVQYFGYPDQINTHQLNLAQSAADMVMVLEVIFGIGLLVRQERTLGICRERYQVRWLLLGFVLGAAPYVFLRTLPQLLNLSAPFPAYIDRILEPAIPLAFVFAIVKYQFLDIDIILRRGLLYGVLAAVAVVLILMPVMIFGFDPAGPTPLAVKMLPVIGGLAAGLLFQPLRMILGRWIDRTFFKIEHRVESLVRELGQELQQASGQAEITRQLHDWTVKALAPQRILVSLTSGDDIVLRGDVLLAEIRSDTLPQPSQSGEYGALYSAPQATTNPETEIAKFPNSLSNNEFVLAISLAQQYEPNSMMFLGAKKSQQRYVNTDLILLKAAAEMASRRIREIRLVQGLVEEQLARRQLNTISHLKDEFLSKVSHDLRTPVTSLGWSLRNLLDGLAGEVNPRQSAYLKTMDQAVSHLDVLVTDLLEISRLETAKVVVPTMAIDLAAVFERAVGTVTPLADVRKIQILIEEQPSLPRVIANGDKLAVVLVNLLGNAVRYSPDSEKIHLVAQTRGNKVQVIVRDHGPGFAGITDPFVRFAQGTPSVYDSGGGYGLGLTIAREYMDLMGGSISAANHASGGAQFTLSLTANKQEMKGEPHES